MIMILAVYVIGLVVFGSQYNVVLEECKKVAKKPEAFATGLIVSWPVLLWAYAICRLTGVEM